MRTAIYEEEIIHESEMFTLVRETPRQVVNVADAVAIVREVIGDDIDKKEHFVVIALNGADHVIYAKTIHIGTLNQSMVHPREVYRDAITGGAARIIVAHNHPSKTMEPSRGDVQTTDRLKDAGRLLGVELLDHVIVTDSGYYSFSDEGRI